MRGPISLTDVTLTKEPSVCHGLDYGRRFPAPFVPLTQHNVSLRSVGEVQSRHFWKETCSLTFKLITLKSLWSLSVIYVLRWVERDLLGPLSPYTS